VYPILKMATNQPISDSSGEPLHINDPSFSDIASDNSPQFHDAMGADGVCSSVDRPKSSPVLDVLDHHNLGSALPSWEDPTQARYTNGLERHRPGSGLVQPLDVRATLCSLVPDSQLNSSPVEYGVWPLRNGGVDDYDADFMPESQIPRYLRSIDFDAALGYPDLALDAGPEPWSAPAPAPGIGSAVGLIDSLTGSPLQSIQTMSHATRGHHYTVQYATPRPTALSMLTIIRHDERPNQVLAKSNADAPKSHVCKWADCRTRFARKGDLHRHVRAIHLLEKAFPCVIAGCDRTGPNGFGRRDKLIEHQRRAHGVLESTALTGIVLELESRNSV
jgi:hypothetical protein